MRETQETAAGTWPKYRPASDIIEQNDGFHIYMDMPGVAKDGLNIDLAKSELTVKARTAYAPNIADTEERKYSHVEFAGAEYRRSFTLSDDVDRDKISANLKDGVLELFLPKSEATKPRKIEISAG